MTTDVDHVGDEPTLLDVLLDAGAAGPVQDKPGEKGDEVAQAEGPPAGLTARAVENYRPVVGQARDQGAKKRPDEGGEEEGEVRKHQTGTWTRVPVKPKTPTALSALAHCGKARHTSIGLTSSSR